MGWHWPKWERLFRDGGRHPKQHPSKRPRFEPTLSVRKLEPRRVLSVTESFAMNVWTLQSDGDPDTVTVSTDATNISITDGVTTFTQAKSDVHRINFLDASGTDSLILDGDVSLMGDAGISLTIAGFETVELRGDYDLGADFSLTGGSLTSFANSMLAVTGNTDIDADMNDVLLADGTISFAGSVSIINSDDIELDVTGSVSLDNVSAAGRLTVTAQDTIEDTAAGVIQVTKAASFTATDIVLDNGLHDFVLTVQATASHDAHLTDVNDMRLHNIAVDNDLYVSSVNLRDTVSGTVTVQRDTRILATNVLLDNGSHEFQRFLSVTTSGNTTISAVGRIRLDEVTVGGHLTVTTDEFVVDTAMGTIAVTQTSSFTAAAVTLDNGLHLFQQNVSSTTSGQTVLSSAGSLILDQLNVSGALIISTPQNITDALNASIQVTGLSRFTANVVLLDSSLNDFVGQVTLTTTSHATLRDATTIVLKEAMIGGVLTLVAGDDIVDQPTGAIQVTGATVLQAANIRWDNGQHDFAGAVSAQTAGDLVLTDVNSIRLHQLVVGGALQVSSGASILDTATGVIDVAQTAEFLAVETVLDNGLHDFRGSVSSDTSLRTILTDINDLLLDLVDVGTTLRLNVARDITQSPAGQVLVTGGSVVNGRDIDLSSSTNDFVGTFTILDARDANVRDANDLTLANVDVTRDLMATAGAGLFDVDTARINVGRDASFAGADLIRFADAATNQLDVVGLASFQTDTAQLIDIGSAGASGAQVRFGSLGLSGGDAEIYETNDTHLAEVSVASLELSTADQVTQVIGTAIDIRDVAPAVGLSLFLRSGDGQVELARGTLDPVSSINTGPLSENRIAGGILISGATMADAGVDATSNVRLRNIAPQAEFVVFNGLPNGTDLTLNDLELHFTHASIAIPDYRIDIRGQLDLWAGLNGDLSDPNVESIGRTITDGSGTELQVAGNANFFASGNITLADTAPALPGDFNLSVAGRASFFIGNFDIIAPSQTRAVSVGVQFVAAANAITRGQLAGNFEAGSLAFHVGTVQRAGNVTIYERGATVIDVGVGGDETNLAATLVLTSEGSITDTSSARIMISGSEDKNAYMRLYAGANDIVLGDESAELRFAVDGVDGPAVGHVQPNGSVVRYVNHYFAAVAANVSLQVDSGINLRDDIGDAQTPLIETNISGTLMVEADGNIYQVGRADRGWLRASRAGFKAESVLLYDTEFESFAADAVGAADVRLMADIADRLPYGSFEPTGTPEQMEEQLALRSSLLPYVLDDNFSGSTVEIDEDGDAYRQVRDVPLAKAPLTSVADVYGIVVQNRETLRVEEVADVAGTLNSIHGIASATGNVYTEARATTTDGDLQFVGNGMHDAIVHVMGNSLFTALASGEIEISNGTVLRSGTGTVTQVGDYMAYDGRVANNTQPKEGVFLDITPPSDGPNAPTSMFLQMLDGGTVTVTQDILAHLGTSGESNLYIAVKWANQYEEWTGSPDVYDVRRYENEVPFKIENMMEVAQPLTVDLSKPFTLTELRNSPFAQLVPTSIMAFNDPGINLYELQGAPADGDVVDLNVSSFTSSATPVGKYPLGQLPDTDLLIPGNYVVAILTIPSPVAPTPSVSVPPLLLESPPPPLALDSPSTPPQVPEFDDVRPTVVLGPDRIDYGRQQNDRLTDPRESWTKGTDVDYEEAIKKEISENRDKWLTSREATEFRIEVRLKNGTYRNIDFWMDIRGKVTEGRLPKNAAPADPTLSPQPAAVEAPPTQAPGPASDQNSPSEVLPVDAQRDDAWLAAWSSWRPPLAEEARSQ